MSDSDDDHDSELDELMRENSVTPSSSEHDDDESSKKRRKSVSVTGKRPMFNNYDSPESTIAVLVVACWTLRLPVMYADFVRYVYCRESRFSARLLETELVLAILYKRRLITRDAAKMPWGAAN